MHDAIDNEKGSTLLETTIALPLLFLCLIVTIELLRVSYIKLSMQFALTETARQSFIQPLDGPGFQALLENELRRYGVFLAPGDVITVCPATGACPDGVINPGVRNEFMSFQLLRSVDLFFLPAEVIQVISLSTFDITARVLGRNEPP